MTSPRRSRFILLLLLIISLAQLGCPAPSPTPYTWTLPAATAPPPVPEDNPMSSAKVALGRRLFYDKRLSINGKVSCASCHKQALAFTDGQAVSVGATGDKTPRSAMSLANVGYRSLLTWGNPLLQRLEQQILVPMFGEFPVELGLSGREGVVFARLAKDPTYQKLFQEAFPAAQKHPMLASVVLGVAAFCRTLISRDAPYDRYLRGDKSALSPKAKMGMALFFSPRLSCFRCHGGVDFNAPHNAQNQPSDTTPWHNTGLYNLDGRGAYPKGGHGVEETSQKPEDMGKFKAPTLRNIEKTGPYMHDGSIATLEGVLAHYAAGGRLLTDGPRAGDGRKSPLKSPLLTGFTLAPEERTALLAFLAALTDETFLSSKAQSDPF